MGLIALCGAHMGLINYVQVYTTHKMKTNHFLQQTQDTTVNY